MDNQIYYYLLTEQKRTNHILSRWFENIKETRINLIDHYYVICIWVTMDLDTLAKVKVFIQKSEFFNFFGFMVIVQCWVFGNQSFIVKRSLKLTDE